MLRKVYIRHREQYPENENLFAALEGFRQLGVETASFYGFGDIEMLPDLGPEVGVCGYVGDVLEALRVVGAPRPLPLDYPEELRSFLGRRVWRSTLGEVRERGERCFIKPVEHKLFSGLVWSSEDAAARRRVVTIDSVTPIWVSDELPTIHCEFRVFVLGGEIVGVKHYKGAWFEPLHGPTVAKAVAEYRTAPAAYSLDFAVCSTVFGPITILIEANDAFALGTYGLECTTYAKMISARWEQLTR